MAALIAKQGDWFSHPLPLSTGPIRLIRPIRPIGHAVFPRHPCLSRKSSCFNFVGQVGQVGLVRLVRLVGLVGQVGQVGLIRLGGQSSYSPFFPVNRYYPYLQ